MQKCAFLIHKRQTFSSHNAISITNCVQFSILTIQMHFWEIWLKIPWVNSDINQKYWNKQFFRILSGIHLHILLLWYCIRRCVHFRHRNVTQYAYNAFLDQVHRTKECANRKISNFAPSAHHLLCTFSFLKRAFVFPTLYFVRSSCTRVWIN